MAADWSALSRFLEDVPPLVRRLAQFGVIVILFAIAYGFVRAWLERRREVVGWSDPQFQSHAALARAIALIVGLVLAAGSAGLLAGQPAFDFIERIIIALLDFVRGVVTVIVWVIGLALAAVGLGLAFGAREAVLGLFGGLTLRANRGGSDHLPSIGDRVRIGEEEGTIEAFSLLSTRLRRDDGSVVFVSNAWVLLGQAVLLDGGAPPGRVSSHPVAADKPEPTGVSS